MPKLNLSTNPKLRPQNYPLPFEIEDQLRHVAAERQFHQLLLDDQEYNTLEEQEKINLRRSIERLRTLRLRRQNAKAGLERLVKREEQLRVQLHEVRSKLANEYHTKRGKALATLRESTPRQRFTDADVDAMVQNSGLPRETVVKMLESIQK